MASNGFPLLFTFPTPRYQEGDRVQWKTLNPDWGVILGRFYEYNHHGNQWTVCYLIQLAPDSPSAAWITADMAWEEDLEKMPDTVLGTVQCWFNRGEKHRPPQPADLRHLAIMDFLLEYFEEIPKKLKTILCYPFHTT